MAIRILSSENITGNLTLSGNQTIGGDLYVTGTSNSNVVISRDNMYVDAGQLYIGADDAATDDTFRQRVTSGSYFIESRKSGTWTNRLQINTAGTLIVQQGMAISGNIDGVGASFIGTAASGAALVTIENNSGSTATSYGLLVKGGGNSASGKTFEVRDDSGNSDLIVKGNGYVGIGTDSPTQSKLVISGGATGTVGGGDAGITMINKFDNPDNSWSILPVITGVSNTGFSIRDNTDSADRLVIDGSGNVGIGDISPSTKIDVYQSTAGIGAADFRHVNGNRILINPSYNYYDAYNHIFRGLSGTNTHMTIDLNGNVGINDTSPDAKLHVMGTTGLPATSGTAFTGTMRLGVSGGYGTVMDFGGVGPLTGTQWIQVTDSSNQAIHYPLLLQPNGGNVGIGTTNPGNLLDVAGDTDISGQLFVQHNGSYIAKLKQLATSMSNATYTFQIDNTAHTSNLSTAGAMSVDVDSGRAFTINGLGNVGIGTDSPANKLTVNGDIGFTGFLGQGSIFGNSGNASYAEMQLYNPATGYTTIDNRSYGYYFATGGSTKVTILNNGNMGVGVTNPSEKLHVNGRTILQNTEYVDYATGNLGTTGVVVATVPTSTNGESVLLTFEATGGTGSVYSVIYSCYNGGGNWYYTKNVLIFGGNIEVAETNGSGSSTLSFSFRATSGSAAYTPRVVMKGNPYQLVSFI
jgi:hypothetical protein